MSVGRSGAAVIVRVRVVGRVGGSKVMVVMVMVSCCCCGGNGYRMAGVVMRRCRRIRHRRVAATNGRAGRVQ